MAALSGRDGVRFVELLAAVPASRQPMKDALEGLVEGGWVARHGGHGHPLRPEYLVTARGRELAPLARAIQSATGRARRRDVLAKKWSLPVLAALLAGSERFNEIRGLLGDSPTPRALALTLKDLEDASLVQRLVGEGRPPQVRYRAVLSPTLQTALENLVAALAD